MSVDATFGEGALGFDIIPRKSQLFWGSIKDSTDGIKILTILFTNHKLCNLPGNPIIFKVVILRINMYQTYICQLVHVVGLSSHTNFSHVYEGELRTFTVILGGNNRISSLVCLLSFSSERISVGNHIHTCSESVRSGNIRFHGKHTHTTHTEFSPLQDRKYRRHNNMLDHV